MAPWVPWTWTPRFVVGNGLAISCGGAVTGAGKQTAGAAVVVVSYYAVALPLGSLLAFRLGWGFTGVTAGMTLGAWLHAVGIAVIVASLRWEVEAEQAVARVQLSAAAGESPEAGRERHAGP